MSHEDHDPTSEQVSAGMRNTRSDRRRRSVRQLLFVVAGAHTGGFLGSTIPSFGLPGDVASLLLIAVLFALPFLVDGNWERIEATYERLGGRLD
ncbi:hypothetical protein [Halorarius litoreus]|uniref:hypothetical protein n=1 Tax=Halorarius litoreus TaxID=2962676 RepID=UPI0020CD506F|nr:hypothetical protein [Halorarius litoreus]